MGHVNLVWNKGFVEELAKKAPPQHQPSLGEASSSHQAPPEWDAYSYFQGLQNEFHQFSLDQADTNHRMEYLQKQTLRQTM